MRACRLSACVVVTLFWSSGCSRSEPSPAARPAAPAPETPQTAFEAFRNAVRQDDWHAAAERLTDKGRAQVCLQLMMAGGVVGAFHPEQQTSIEDIFQRHGLKSDGEAPFQPAGPVGSLAEMITSSIQDKPAFISEMMSVLRKADADAQSWLAAAGELRNVEVAGEEAAAEVVTEGDVQRVTFRRIDGIWRMELDEASSGLSFGSGMSRESSSFHTDPLREFDNWQAQFIDDIDLPPPGEIPLDTFNASWQTSLNEADVPAGELIRRLGAELQLEWVPPDETLPQLDQPVSVQAEGISRLEAIERAAEQAGLYPRYLLDKFTVAAGPRPMPVAFAGPFLVEVDSVSEIVPAAAATVELRFFAAGLPEAAVALLDRLRRTIDKEGAELATLKVSRRVGSHGKSLEHPGTDAFGFMSLRTRSAIQWSQSVPLLDTTRDVTEVESLAGEFTFQLPTRVETLPFDRLAEGAAVREGEAAFTLRQTTRKSSFRVDFSGAAYDRVKLIGRNANGDAMEPTSTGGSWGDGKGTQQASFDEEVATLEVQLLRELERVNYPFELRGIALARYAEQPERREPLRIEGPSPLTLEFLEFAENEFGQQGARVKLRNHTNRPITGFTGTMHYLDAAGKELDDFPASHHGEAIPSGGEQTTSLSTFFMPEGTKSITVDIEKLTFIDLTAWSADEAEAAN